MKDYCHIFNSLEGHVLVITPDLMVAAVSNGFLKTAGLKRDELIGKDVTVFFLDKQKNNDFQVSLRNVLETKKTHHIGLVEWGEGSDTSFWKAKTYPLFHEHSDTIQYLIHETYEVTHEIQKQQVYNAVEKELLKQTTLTDILDRQSDGFFVMGQDEAFKYVNKFMVNFGIMMKTDNLLGRSVKEVFTSKDTERFLNRYRHVIRTQTPDHFIDCLDDRYLSVDAYPTQDGSVAVFFRDVTDKLKAEKDLLENRAKLQIITDHIPAFVSYFDSEGRYQFVNQTYLEWFELSKNQIIGKRREDFASPSTTEIAKTYEAKALAGETVKHQNVLTKREKTIYVDVCYVPDIDFETNTVRGAVVIAYDTTEQVLAKQSVENALQLREDFMSIASHELKTPITAMYLQNQILIRHSRKSEMIQSSLVQTFVENMDANIKRLNRLIDDMLDITRINNGKLALTPESFDLASLARNVAERYTDLDIPIKVIQHDTVIGLWDKIRIDQVISNLLTNSIKYGNNSPIVINVYSENNKAILKVKDHGPGIAKEHQQRIFQRFERESDDVAVTGLGLGLFICKEIIERHLGEISVESEPGMGAEFKIILPLK